ncbi:hypothetical protein LEF69_22675, partial [Salmonella enterica]|nr:hypothetical protein [Salmonella enterica]MDJ8641787.1 hypothetical protein [Salmonella enterica]
TDAVAPYARQDDFGKMDGSGEPDWESKDAFNWVLLSSPEENSVMMVSDNSLSEMLEPDFYTHWRSFFCTGMESFRRPVVISLTICLMMFFLCSGKPISLSARHMSSGEFWIYYFLRGK